MRMLRIFVVAVMAVLLTGCAATGPKFSEVQASMPAVRAGEGRIFVFRLNTPIGAALRPDVRVGGMVVGAPQPGSFFFVDRPAGHHAATARTEAESSVEFELAEGESVYISLQINMGVLVGRPQLLLHPPVTGASALQDLAYVGSIPLVPGRADPITAGAVRGGTQQQPEPPTRRSAVTMEDLRGLLPATPEARQ